MAQSSLIGDVHRFLEVRASLRRQTADALRQVGSLVPGNAIQPETRPAREGDCADAVLGLKFSGEDPQAFVNDANAIRPFHGAGIIEQQNQVQWFARLAALRGCLEREAENVAI